MNPINDPSSTKYPDRVFHAGAWRTPKQIESFRSSVRRATRKYRGSTIPLDAPALSAHEAARRAVTAHNANMTPTQRRAAGRRANATRRLRVVAEDAVAMKMLEERVPRTAKLIRLAFHPATPLHEKRRALDKLIPTTPAPEVQ